ncbi:249_t:CDS:2, partial [Funneliformis geosporum]
GLDDTLRGLQGFLKEHRDKFHRSYIDFLTLNRQLLRIYYSIWTKSADDGKKKKVSGPTIANRFADLEHTNSICLPIGKKCSLKGYSVKLTLHMFDESDKFYGKQLRLPYQEDATSSGDIRDNILDSDLIPPERTKKFKPDEENVDLEEVNSDNFLDNILQMTSFAYQQFTATYQKSVIEYEAIHFTKGHLE